MTPRYVILGAPRSGTGYISRALTSVGLDCSHEAWWGNGPPVRHLGDASWLAMPDVEAGLYDGIVMAQVRHPLDVIGSIVHGDLWLPSSSAYLTHAINHSTVPGPTSHGYPERLRWATAWTVDWMTRCLRLSQMAWQVEYLTGRVIRDVAETLGMTPTAAPEVMLEQVPVDVNHRGSVPPLTWQELDAAGVPTRYVAALTSALGYANTAAEV